MLTYGLNNFINVSTYVSPITSSDTSCQDHMWHNLNITVKSYIVYPCLTDHYFIAIVFETHLYNRPISIKFRDYSEANGNNFFRSILNSFKIV